jgi:hypothetical protein
MTKEVVLAIRELMRQEEVNALTRDLAAFISMRLKSIYETIDLTVAAWEKRGYWVKADRFRLDWAWSGTLSQDLKDAIQAEDWQQVAVTSAKAAQKLNNVQVSERHRLGKPWIGVWDEFTHQE